MNAFGVIRIVTCIFVVVTFLYLYVDKHNALTELRLELPKLSRQKRALDEENARLQYQIDCFENPLHLMSLLGQKQFSQLQHPVVDDIVILPEGRPLSCDGREAADARKE